MVIQQSLEKIGNQLFKKRSYIPLLVIPFLFLALPESEFFERNFGDTTQTCWELFCILISFAGLFIRSLTVGWVTDGTSGRNTKGQLAGSLNTKGMYSIVRHPLYLGNFFIVLGFFLFVQVWWFVLISLMAFLLFYEHIIFAEESFLERKFGSEFQNWARRTPVFLPDFSLWEKPSTLFSWRMVVKREYSTIFGIIAGFVFIKFFAELIAEREFVFRRLWVVFLVAGFLVYFVCRILRKNTKVFTDK